MEVGRSTKKISLPIYFRPHANPEGIVKTVFDMISLFPSNKKERNLGNE